MATINAVVQNSTSDQGEQFEGGTSVDTNPGPDNPFAIGTGTAASSPDRHHAFRFQLPTIASGDTVDDATFTLTKSGGEWKTWQVTFYLEAADNSASIATGSISGRTLTTSNVNNNTNVNHTDGSTFTVDLTAALQEVIDRAGWSASNYVSVICVGDGASNFANKSWHSYGSGTSGQRPTLDVTYTASGGGGGGPTPLPIYNRRRAA